MQLGSPRIPKKNPPPDVTSSPGRPKGRISCCSRSKRSITSSCCACKVSRSRFTPQGSGSPARAENRTCGAFFFFFFGGFRDRSARDIDLKAWDRDTFPTVCRAQGDSKWISKCGTPKMVSVSVCVCVFQRRGQPEGAGTSPRSCTKTCLAARARETCCLENQAKRKIKLATNR